MTPKQIIAFAIGPLGAAVLGLLTLPFVAWFFPPDDIGRLSMLQVVSGFAILLFSLGLDQAYVREFHEVTDRPALLKAAILPGFALLTVALACLLLLPWSISELLFGIDSRVLTSLLVTAVFLQFFSRFLSLILRMQEKGLAYSMSQLLPKFLFLAILICYLLFSIEAVFVNLMIANVLSLFAVFLIYAWNTRHDWLTAFVATVDKIKQRQMIQFGMPLIGGGIAFWGLTATDKLFLRGLSSFEELGIYSISISFAAAALVFQAIFSTVWAPIVYKWASEGIDPSKIKSVIDYSTLAVVTIWSLAGMFSWLVDYILPTGYENVKYILLATMAYPLLYTLSEATGVGIGVRRKTAYSMLAAIIALIANALGNWYLIPEYGAAGAAIASAIAFLIFFIIRTEASSSLWQSFERKKMYILIVVMVSLSIFFNIQTVDPVILFFTYITTLICAFILFKTQLTTGLSYIYQMLLKQRTK